MRCAAPPVLFDETEDDPLKPAVTPEIAIAAVVNTVKRLPPVMFPVPPDTDPDVTRKFPPADGLMVPDTDAEPAELIVGICDAVSV